MQILEDFYQINMETLDSINSNIKPVVEITNQPNSYTFWVLIISLALVLLTVLGLYLFHIRNKNRNKLDPNLSDTIKEAKNNSIDMGNIIISINNAPELYKKLSKMYHPDKYAGTDYEGIANNIFQAINAKRRDYNSLLKIQQLAEEKLPSKV
jgi:hypothetical protein